MSTAQSPAPTDSAREKRKRKSWFSHPKGGETRKKATRGLVCCVAFYVATAALMIFGKESKAVAELWMFANTTLSLYIGLSLGYMLGRRAGNS